ncbi:hypothetical protein Q7P37_002424 [Cladosporium fusiforme]
MSTTQQPPSAPSGPTKEKKHFVPLENNPTTMTTLLHTLGLSPSLSFHDVFSIDDPDLLSFVPRPAHALLLVFPVSKSYETFRTQEDAKKHDCFVEDKDDDTAEDKDVIWYKQTIGNACGLIGLLHGVSNGAAKEHILPDSDLDAFVREASTLSPRARAELIESSDALEQAHATAAAGGDTAAPEAGEDVDLHYVCFVKGEESGTLWELDGRRKGPIRRGVLGEGEDVLSERALDAGVRRFIEREKEGGVGEVRFGLVALAEGLD